MLRREADERAAKAAAAAEEHQKRRDAEAAIALERVKTGQPPHPPRHTLRYILNRCCVLFLLVQLTLT